MILIACVDPDNGMSFYGRRQSRDREVIRRIFEDASGSRLWMADSSYPLFSGLDDGRIQTAEDFLCRAGAGEHCFAEQLEKLPNPARLECVVLYRWDKRYPADSRFPADLEARGWRRIRTEAFPGYSHKTIEKEIYIR